MFATKQTYAILGSIDSSNPFFQSININMLTPDFVWIVNSANGPVNPKIFGCIIETK